MRKKKLFGLLAIGLIVMFGCEQRSSDYSDSMPDDFNFIANIADNSYIFDTYRGKLTKTIDWKRDTTISYQLPIGEKQKIYKLLKNIDIYKYPLNYAPTSTVKISPTFSYCFKFTINGIDHKINWKENTESEIKEARELRKLFLEIQNILEKDELIIELPLSKRAFY
ncbi:hypothetical protein [Lentimicrobium sp. S6]|uniref:hypothetical protein n=1 Tax=Lentimicrobium sp. S6 TaxID=2735872 RepID=UPI0015560640|nr:hypothetical protein [Lentimicrobium sp. S6]NPD45463.1 hypothetical protein [Lentimicrobium sp. S6]